MSGAAPRIKTTLVGSYPIPDWLAAYPTEQGLIDATRVVLHTQERAGIESGESFGGARRETPETGERTAAADRLQQLAICGGHLAE